MKKVEPSIIALIEDSMNTMYPQLAVEAMFKIEKRQVLRQKLLEDHRRFLDESNVDQVLSELVGLGVFEDIINDETVTDIGWNGSSLWIDRGGKPERMDIEGLDDKYIRKIVQRFANYAHRDFSEKEPRLNTQLGNIRINAMHHSISPIGVTMSMRHARSKLVLTPEIFQEMADISVYHLMEDMMTLGTNVVITGETGCGKTEVQKLLIGMIPSYKKVIMIEDTLETHLKTIYPDKNILSWLVIDGFNHTDMIKESLRNNAHYVVLSEARDHAIYEIHQSVLTGHKIILTGHAVDAHAFPTRMIGMTKQKYDVNAETLMEEILRYYHIGIHLEKRVVNHKTMRYISEIVEYTENGLKTLYKRTINMDGDANGEVRIEEKFGRISDDLETQLKQHGITTAWHNRFKKDVAS